MINLSEIPKRPGIYKFTNLINGKIYIGESQNLYRRTIQHKSLKNESVFHSAIKKHGWENFKVEIIYQDDYIDSHILLFLETSMIYQLNSIDRHIGYNKTLYIPNTFGIKQTEESKLNMKNGLIRTNAIRREAGIPHPNQGRKHSEESRIKIGLKSKAYRHSQESRNRISKAMMGNQNRKWKGCDNPSFNKNIYQFKNRLTNETFIGHKYNFYIKYGLSPSNVGDLIYGRSKSYRNWIFLGEVIT